MESEQPRQSKPSSGAPETGSGSDVQRIVEQLRSRISEHEIAPGSKLKEQDIAREFGVSRTKVREALAALEIRGFVARTPNRGAVARRLELSQVFEIYDVREVLEGLAVRRAVENGRREIWAELLAEADGAFEERVLAGELHLYEKLFQRFRKEVIDAAANPVLTDMLDSVRDQTNVTLRRVVMLPGRAEQGLRNLRLALEAMKAGDAAGAERLRRNGIREAIAALKHYQRFVL
ncbi:GntR family transcriptional regulator [Pikeienuella piscinae]|uniref:GntR family transcriptional regulator n=1 Tax=Pikeienuella piscinae TaxID=2748098 RepID=A0A7L5BWT4_9RHOB|nr:GntR family transcriptional regulator [Pikeienuella piscinae]QIE56192.1 GntR family transcriptional regulator [Pikeienuella piscinae]